MKSLLTLFAAFMLASAAHAMETKIAVTSSDVDTEKGELALEVVEGHIDSVRVYKYDGVKITGDESYPLEKLVQDGLVAIERSGHQVVVLKLENFNSDVGGTVVIDYLVNAVTGKRAKQRLKLVKESEEEGFGLKTLNERRVNRLHFRANKVLFKIVGIKSVEVSYK